MATLLSVTNRVLRRLRELEVANTTDNAYATLIADFVSDIYQECVESGKWRALTHEFVQDLTASQTSYNISVATGGGGDASTSLNATLPKANSVPLMYSSGIHCFIYDDSSDTEGSPMVLMSPEDLDARTRIDEDQTVSDPIYYTLDVSSDNELYMRVWPAPSTSRRMKMKFYTEPDVLEVDGSDDATDLRLPDRPVFLGALYYALNERGEEIGEAGGIAERRYYDALGAALESNSKVDEFTNVYDWYRN